MRISADAAADIRSTSRRHILPFQIIRSIIFGKIFYLCCSVFRPSIIHVTAVEYLFHYVDENIYRFMCCQTLL